jgi:hypothetical protein
MSEYLYYCHRRHSNTGSSRVLGFRAYGGGGSLPDEVLVVDLSNDLGLGEEVERTIKGTEA